MSGKKNGELLRAAAQISAIMCLLGEGMPQCCLPNAGGNQDRNVNVLGTPHFKSNPNADQKPDSIAQCTKVPLAVLAEKTCSESGTNALLSWQLTSPAGPHSLTQHTATNDSHTQLLECNSKNRFVRARMRTR